MENPSLYEQLSRLRTATPELVRKLTGLFVPVTFRRGTLLSVPDHTLPVLYFIEKGVVRGYYFYHQEEYTCWIRRGGFLLPGIGYFSDSYSIEYIQFLSDTTVWSLSLPKVEVAMRSEPLFYRMLLEMYEIKVQEGKERELMLRLKFAEDRNLYARKNFADLFEHVAIYILASFIGIERKYIYKFKKKYK
ncbi:Crp/Fnr family transcriptional regulator [Pedobacter psychroterrae]|uniref:Crp/Fnr family transcriptional regulator n=1 Tax=Pedobacter psychroterrae TaxID=2530453 RepID=A0A4R0NHE1_9SPHI|nr:Crp/Fnr family transcriptional regulator [Pedobacter psychroterrae]TCC99991.1 Crp/Fnr family transcriptional regulator [Pedobacter psychroterrae]